MAGGSEFPKANHRLDGAKNPVNAVNDGSSTTNLQPQLVKNIRISGCQENGYFKGLPKTLLVVEVE